MKILWTEISAGLSAEGYRGGVHGEPDDAPRRPMELRWNDSVGEQAAAAAATPGVRYSELCTALPALTSSCRARRKQK